MFGYAACYVILILRQAQDEDNFPDLMLSLLKHEVR